MTEHDHREKIVLETIEQSVPSGKIEETSGAWLIAGSILLGAVLISGSIIYGVKTLSKTPGSHQALQTAAADTKQQPNVPVSVTDRTDEPIIGSSNAKVTMVEFGDFQCPFCKQYFQNNFPEIKSKYIDTGKVKLVFRHFPLTQIHVNAQISAIAAECANQQGEFWAYHDILYASGQSNGDGLDQASLEKYADQLGLNKGTLGLGKNKFNQCLESKATLDTVNKDQAEGAKDGVGGTPTFFVDGQPIVGAQPLEVFETAIDAALKQ